MIKARVKSRAFSVSSILSPALSIDNRHFDEDLD
jgi:hypothetical protein